MHFTHFLILDDDPISGLINELAVNETVGKWSTRIFSDPEACLEFIRTEKHVGDFHTCLMLDINMPKLNGWQFLDRLQQLPKQIQSQYSVVIVTSSLDPADREHAEMYPIVCGYLTKPVTGPLLNDFLMQYELWKQSA